MIESSDRVSPPIRDKSCVGEALSTSREYPKARAILIGDSGTGKTSLVKQLSTGVFEPMCSPTIGIDYHLHVFSEQELEGLRPSESHLAMDIWDSAGQERFRALSSSYFRDISGVLLVFDLSNHRTFQNLESWLNYIYEHTNEDSFVLLLVGNKCDLEKKVSEEEIRLFCSHRNIKYVETSATDNAKTQHLFQQMGEEIIKRGHFRGVEGVLMPDKDKRDTIKLQTPPRERRVCCT